MKIVPTEVKFNSEHFGVLSDGIATLESALIEKEKEVHMLRSMFTHLVKQLNEVADISEMDFRGVDYSLVMEVNKVTGKVKFLTRVAG